MEYSYRQICGYTDAAGRFTPDPSATIDTVFFLRNGRIERDVAGQTESVIPEDALSLRCTSRDRQVLAEMGIDPNI